MERREFLTRSIAGAGGLLLGARFAPAETQTPGKHTLAERVKLGNTKIEVSRVGLGTGMRGGNRQSNHTRMGQVLIGMGKLQLMGPIQTPVLI